MEDKKNEGTTFLPYHLVEIGGTTTCNPDCPGTPFSHHPYRSTAKNHGAWLCTLRLITKELKDNQAVLALMGEVRPKLPLQEAQTMSG